MTCFAWQQWLLRKMRLLSIPIEKKSFKGVLLEITWFVTNRLWLSSLGYNQNFQKILYS